MKLYRIKLHHKFWTNKKSIIPVWTDTGDFFTKDEIESLIRKFKYQHKLWPADVEIVEYDISTGAKSNLVDELFKQQNIELSFETLKGSAY